MHHKGEEGVSQHSPGGKPDGRWSCYWSCCQSLSLGMRVRAQAGLGKGAAVSLAPRTCSPHSVHLCSGQPQDTQSFSTSWPTPTPGHLLAIPGLWPVLPRHCDRGVSWLLFQGSHVPQHLPPALNFLNLSHPPPLQRVKRPILGKRGCRDQQEPGTHKTHTS